MLNSQGLRFRTCACSAMRRSHPSGDGKYRNPGLKILAISWAGDCRESRNNTTATLGLYKASMCTKAARLCSPGCSLTAVLHGKFSCMFCEGWCTAGVFRPRGLATQLWGSKHVSLGSGAACCCARRCQPRECSGACSRSHICHLQFSCLSHVVWREAAQAAVTALPPPPDIEPRYPKPKASWSVVGR